MIIAPTTSRLGAGPTIQIRGRSSLSLDNSPLLYVDGVRVSNATAVGATSVSGGGSSFGGQNSNVAGRLNDINPEDIESIEVIKGPAAATIYGTEAANGVIQIITKKGAPGRTDFNVSVETGSLYFRDAEGRMPTNYVKDHVGHHRARGTAFSQEEDRGTPLFKTGQTRQYTASLSGGRDSDALLRLEPVRERLRHRAEQLAPPVRPAREPQRRADLEARFRRRASTTSTCPRTSAPTTVCRRCSGATVGHGLLFRPHAGSIRISRRRFRRQLYDNAQGVSRFTGSGTINHRPIDWFTQHVIVGVDYTGDDSSAIEQFARRTSPCCSAPSSAGGRIGQTLRHNTIITADYAGTARAPPNVVPLLRDLGRRTVLPHGAQHQLPRRVRASPAPASRRCRRTANKAGCDADADDQHDDRRVRPGAVRAARSAVPHGGPPRRQQQRVRRRLQVGDVSEGQPRWVVNEEPFWRVDKRDQHAASCAQRTASRAVSRTRSRRCARSFPSQGPGGSNAVTPNSIGNPDLKPERGKEIELGFETELFNRLSLDFTYFSKQTDDEILNQPIAPSSGFTGNQFVNLGRVDNHGIELQATLQALTANNVSLGHRRQRRDEPGRDQGSRRPSASVVASAGQTTSSATRSAASSRSRVVSADRDPTTGLATNVLCDGRGWQARRGVRDGAVRVHRNADAEDDGSGHQHGLDHEQSAAVRDWSTSSAATAVRTRTSRFAARGSSAHRSAARTTTRSSTRRSTSPRRSGTAAAHRHRRPVLPGRRRSRSSARVSATYTFPNKWLLGRRLARLAHARRPRAAHVDRSTRAPIPK